MAYPAGISRLWARISNSLYQYDRNNVVLTNVPSNLSRGFWFNVKDKEFTLDIKQGAASDEEKPYIRFLRGGAVKGSIYQANGNANLDLQTGIVATGGLVASSYITATKLAWGSGSGDVGLNREDAGRLCLYDANTLTNYRDFKLRNLIGTGNLATGAVAKTADYTATTSDGTIEVDASGAARTITLFACSANAGKIIVVKKIDSSANAVTVDGNASETIDGATTISLASQYSTAILQVNTAGTGWNKLGGV